MGASVDHCARVPDTCQTARKCAEHALVISKDVEAASSAGNAKAEKHQSDRMDLTVCLGALRGDVHGRLAGANHGDALAPDQLGGVRVRHG